MPGIDITVTQMYDKAVIGGLDYEPSSDALSGYEYLVAKRADGNTTPAINKHINIEPLLEPDQWFVAFNNSDSENPFLERKKASVDSSCIRFNKEFQTQPKKWESIDDVDTSSAWGGTYFLVIYNGQACWACKSVTNDVTEIYVKSSTANQLVLVAPGDELLYVGYELGLYDTVPTSQDILATIDAARNTAPAPSSGSNKYLLDSVDGLICTTVDMNNEAYLVYEDVNYDTDENTHTFITIEPYFREDGKLDVRLSTQSGTLDNISYPYLAGFVDTSTGQIDGLFFVEDRDVIPSIAENYPDLSFVILQPHGASGVSSDEKAVFPFTGQGPVWTEYSLYAGNVSGNVPGEDNDHDLSWFAKGEVGGSDYVLTPKTLAEGDDPNLFLKYTSWMVSGNIPPSVNISYADLEQGRMDQDRQAIASNIQDVLNGCHLVAEGVSSPVLVDVAADLSDVSEYPFYMCCVVEEKNKKTSITSGSVNFSKTFYVNYPDTIEPYSSSKVYDFGDFCFYDGDVYVYISNVPGVGVPPTDTDRWATESSMVIEGSVTARLQSITATTFTSLAGNNSTGTRTSSRSPITKKLINTRALRIQSYTNESDTGISSDINEALFPATSGNGEYTFTRRWSDVPTNFYGSDPKNGQTTVYPIFNLYRGVGSVDPERDSLFVPEGEFSLFSRVATDIFPYLENESTNEAYVVTVTDSEPIEPLTGYTYVLTYAFSPSRAGSMLSNEYVCQTFDKTSGITLFRYDTPTVHFGLNDTQYVSSYVEYLGDAADQSVTQTVEAGTGARYIYLILGETTGNTLEDSTSVDIPVEVGVTNDINMTILGHARVPAEYHQYAPTFSGTARLRFVDVNETSSANDLYTANSPKAIAAVQNATTGVLPSVTWVPSTDEYMVRFFTIVSSEDVSAQLKTLLFDGTPFSFKRYQVLATALVPAEMKDAECEVITNFRLDFT